MHVVTNPRDDRWLTVRRCSERRSVGVHPAASIQLCESIEPRGGAAGTVTFLIRLGAEIKRFSGKSCTAQLAVHNHAHDFSVSR